VSAKKASVWKRRDGCGTGWNTLALCVGYAFYFVFLSVKCHCCTVAPPLVPNGCVYEMLGLRETDLSAVAKADAGQSTSQNHLNPNVLYMMLCAELYNNVLIAFSISISVSPFL